MQVLLMVDGPFLRVASLLEWHIDRSLISGLVTY